MQLAEFPKMTIDQKIEAARERVKKRGASRISVVETIQACAIAAFGVERESFFNGERTRRVADARMTSMSLCRKQTSLTLEEIGMLHGGLNHASVCHAIRQTDFAMTMTDPMQMDFKRGIDDVLALLIDFKTRDVETHWTDK